MGLSVSKDLQGSAVLQETTKTSVDEAVGTNNPSEVCDKEGHAMTKTDKVWTEASGSCSKEVQSTTKAGLKDEEVQAPTKVGLEDEEVQALRETGTALKEGAMKGMVAGPNGMKGDETITFNVGGHLYTFARTTLDLYPQTMLSRIVAKEWKDDEDGNYNKPIFIDRDGSLFRFVLNYMRNLKVTLPVTESKQALLSELEYYGFENVNEDLIQADSSVTKNFYDGLEEFDGCIKQHQEKVNELQWRKTAFKAAYFLFVRKKGRGIETVQLKDEDLKVFGELYGGNFESPKLESKEVDYLKEYLQHYGLKLGRVSFSHVWVGYSSFCDVTVGPL